MAKIRIQMLENLNADFEQYQVVGAIIELNGKEFVLDSIELDNENDYEDLELVEAFGTQYEMIAKNENMVFEIDKEVDELQFDLEQNIEREEEENDKAWERSQN